jgi:hypothetical protein
MDQILPWVRVQGPWHGPSCPGAQTSSSWRKMSAIFQFIFKFTNELQKTSSFRFKKHYKVHLWVLHTFVSLSKFHNIFTFLLISFISGNFCNFFGSFGINVKFALFSGTTHKKFWDIIIWLAHLVSYTKRQLKKVTFLLCLGFIWIFFLGLKIPNFLKKVKTVVHYCITLCVHIYE